MTNESDPRKKTNAQQSPRLMYFSSRLSIACPVVFTASSNKRRVLLLFVGSNVVFRYRHWILIQRYLPIRRLSTATHVGRVELIQLRDALDCKWYLTFGSFLVWVEINILSKFFTNGGKNSISVPRRINFSQANQSSVHIQEFSFAGDSRRHGQFQQESKCWSKAVIGNLFVQCVVNGVSNSFFCVFFSA